MVNKLSNSHYNVWNKLWYLYSIYTFWRHCFCTRSSSRSNLLMQHVKIVYVIINIICQTSTSSKIQFICTKFVFICSNDTCIVHILWQINVFVLTRQTSIALFTTVEASFKGYIRNKHFRVPHEIREILWLVLSIVGRLRKTLRVFMKLILIALMHQVV